MFCSQYLVGLASGPFTGGDTREFFSGPTARSLGFPWLGGAGGERRKVESGEKRKKSRDLGGTGVTGGKGAGTGGLWFPMECIIKSRSDIMIIHIVNTFCVSRFL